MSAFATTIPTVPADSAPIAAGAFWPVVDPDTARLRMRIDGGVSPDRLRAELIEAIGAVVHQLAAWAALRMDEGYDTLADVPALEVDSATVHVHRFHRAVGCLAKASILERYRDYDSGPQADKKAGLTDTTIDDLRRDAAWAIRDILGESRSTVELI